MKNLIKIARGPKTDMENNTSVVPEEGVPIYNTTEKKLYIGNGVKNLKQLYDEGGITVTNATSSTYAEYASSDTSKGTIEERLTNLGFKTGVVENLVATASTNYLKRQGNYVIGQLDISQISLAPIVDLQQAKMVIGVLPENFRPKEGSFFIIPTYPASCSAIVSTLQGRTVCQFCKNFKVHINNQTGEISVIFGYSYWTSIDVPNATKLYKFEKDTADSSSNVFRCFTYPPQDLGYSTALCNNTAILYDFSMTFGFEAAPIE